MPDCSNRLVIPMARKILERSRGGEAGLLSIMLAMAAGRQEGPPFEDEAVVELREWLANALRVPTGDRGAEEGQAMHLKLAGAPLKERKKGRKLKTWG